MTHRFSVALNFAALGLISFLATASRAETMLGNLGPAVGFGRGLGTSNPPSEYNIRFGVAFRTGSELAGYHLNSVTLHLGGVTGSGVGDFFLDQYQQVNVNQWTGPIGEFVVPSNPTAAGLYSFDFAEKGLALSPLTFYMIGASSPNSTGPTTSQYGWRLNESSTRVVKPGWQFGGPSTARHGTRFGPASSNSRSTPPRFQNPPQQRSLRQRPY